MARSAASELGKRLFVVGEERSAARAQAVPFPELAYLHYQWRRALETTSPDLDAKAKLYHDARAVFEAEHGAIVDEYWCWHVPSAVVLTEKPRRRLVSLVLRPRVAFHRASDWATKDHPDVAEQVHRCDEVAIRATQVLSGLRRRICLQLVMTSAAHLLSFVDTRAAHDRTKAVLRQEKEALDATFGYYCDAANGQAQIVYFTAMAIVAAVLGVVALFGAVVSVIQRINSGHFNLTYDVGRPYVAFLGGLRPVLGAAFGLVLYFAVTSGLLTIFDIPEAGSERLFTFLVVAFLAGFSERWAQDTLTSLGQGSGKTDPTTPRPSQDRSQ
jgi:hypothetical protein